MIANDNCERYGLVLGAEALSELPECESAGGERDSSVAHSELCGIRRSSPQVIAH